MEALVMSTEQRLIALCAGAHLRSWIEGEIGDLIAWRFYAGSVAEIAGMLARGGASRSELLVLDLDLLTPSCTLELKTALEERWWNGTIVGLGGLRGVHRRYLCVDRTIARPFGSEALRAYVERSEGEVTQPG
jgi:hypothetical protein